MALIDHYISQISKDTSVDKMGGTHSCFLFPQYALLKGVYIKDCLDVLIQKTKDLKEQGVSVVPTIEYKIDKTHPDFPNMFRGYVLQRKAKGTELYSGSYAKQSPEEYINRIDELSKQPQKFFDKYVSDWMKICQSGLQIDPSKSANFFYSADGISFIDLGVSRDSKSLENAFLSRLQCCLMVEHIISTKIKKNIRLF